jgi:cell division protein ZapA
MAEIIIEIGGRRYDVACRDGEEDHLRDLGRLVDEKSTQARASMGGVNEVRQLLFAALLLADELKDARDAIVVAPEKRLADAVAASGEIDPGVALAIERLADRVEKVAERLEGGARAS